MAAAIIRQGGRYLITKRNHDVMFGGLWEFPGGKRHPGETLEDCLRREMKEELGIDVAVQDLFCEAIYPYSHSQGPASGSASAGPGRGGIGGATAPHGPPHTTLILYFYNCSIRGGEIMPLGCQDFRWVTPEELPQYSFPPANSPLICELV